MAQIIQQGHRWKIGGEVVFSNASALLKTTTAFDNSQPIIIDFAQVTNVDTSAISLMLEWQRRAAAVQSSASFVNLPPNLLSLANLYGVEEIIEQSTSN